MSTTKPPGPADTLAPGAMDLFDAYKPSLEAGSYRLLLQQTVTLGSSETYHYRRDQSFVVSGPRLTLDPAEIHSAFPPAGATGEYGQDIPYLVLRGRALPWERRIDGNADGLPWMALLILDDADYQRAGGAACLTSTTVKAFLEAPKKLQPALLDLNDDPATPLQVLQLPAQLFGELVPKRGDLRQLAHLRRVSMLDKPLEGNPGEGSFAIVLGNRFCPPGANHIFLVSLEGWGDVLDGRRTIAVEERVRLVCLMAWTFTNQAGNHTFGGLARGLSLRTVGARPAPGVPDVNPLLAAAYAQLNFGPEGPAAQAVWYRGPFAPSPVAALAPADLLAERVMPDDRPDISYRAAWQLGRMLALAAPSFSTGLRAFLEVCRDSVEAAKRIETYLDLHRQNPGEPRSESFNLAFELVEWLARLLLLYPVPFHYLLADTRQLPGEALRFFHVDDNWLTALADGALSSAVHSRADLAAGSGIRFRDALAKIVLRYRLEKQGRLVPPELTADFFSAAKTGFLLRSSLVSDWPGLEVDVELVEDPQPDLPSLLRLDHLGNGVLFGLARGRVKRVVLRQPPEGLRFGVAADGKLALRRLDTLAPTGAAVEKVPEAYQRKPAKILDVDRLTGDLRQKLGLAAEGFGSAAFAIQLIRAPESQAILWQHPP